MFVAYAFQLCTTDRDALTALYNENGGANWVQKANWLSDSSICTWYGVGCNRDGLVTDLNLPNNRLTGQITEQIGCLVFIQRMIIFNNTMNSTLPDVFCNLSNLMNFEADHAGFVGALPTCMCTMQHMQYFYLSNNAITGQIPTCVGSMTFLREMHLNCDLITGTVPVGFNTLQYLIELRLQCNVGLDCTSDLSTRSNFVYLCGDFQCDTCILTPTNCPAFIDIPNCPRYYRSL